MFRDSSGWMKLRGMGGVSWGGVGIARYIPFSTAVHVDGGGVAVVSDSWGSQGSGSERAVGRGLPLNVARSGVIGQTEKNFERWCTTLDLGCEGFCEDVAINVLLWSCTGVLVSSELLL